MLCHAIKLLYENNTWQKIFNEAVNLTSIEICHCEIDKNRIDLQQKSGVIFEILMKRKVSLWEERDKLCIFLISAYLSEDSEKIYQ